MRFNKNQINLPQKSIISVFLQLYLSTGPCYINGKYNHSYYNEYRRIDITDLFKNDNLTDIAVEITNYQERTLSLSFAENKTPKLSIEYVENDIQPKNKTFNLVNGVSGNLNANTCELVPVFRDMDFGSSILPCLHII